MLSCTEDNEVVDDLRAGTLAELARIKPDLVSRFGVTRLFLFGSTARGTARADSDIDLVVSFEGAATSARVFGVQFAIEDALGRPVDLVTDKMLRGELRASVEKDWIEI